MLRFASTAICVALILFLSAHVSPADARVMPPIQLSDDAVCWYGELYGVTGIICRDDGKLYHCAVARTECWFAIPPGPYNFTRGGGANVAAAAQAQRTRR